MKKIKTTNNNKKPSWLNSFTKEEISEIFKFNFESFYKMKEELVKKRKSICTQEQIAESFGVTTDEIDEFEALLRDSSVSLIQKYASAVGMKIYIKVENCEKDKNNK